MYTYVDNVRLLFSFNRLQKIFAQESWVLPDIKSVVKHTDPCRNVTLNKIDTKIPMTLSRCILVSRFPWSRQTKLCLIVLPKLSVLLDSDRLIRLFIYSWKILWFHIIYHACKNSCSTQWRFVGFNKFADVNVRILWQAIRLLSSNFIPTYQ